MVSPKGDHVPTLTAALRPGGMVSPKGDHVATPTPALRPGGGPNGRDYRDRAERLCGRTWTLFMPGLFVGPLCGGELAGDLRRGFTGTFFFEAILHAPSWTKVPSAPMA